MTPPVPGLPGVRREDVRPPRPRTFVTGVPVFVGFAELATAEHPQRTLLGPQRLGSAADLGPEAETGFLADAVQGFFANGGTTCLVLWADPGADPVAAVRAALEAIEEEDDVDLVCLPDLMTWPDDAAVVNAQRAVVEHCAARGDRFAILDALFTPEQRTVLDQQARLTGRDGAFGALYHPWLRVPTGDVIRYVPPCGHLAGTYAAGDSTTGVHHAPANVELEGVLDVAVDLTDAETGSLYAAGVNPVRALPGRGIRAWGARTASDTPEWRNIPVRRLVSTIARWTGRFLTTAVHEPNDVRLWVRIMREVTAGLEVLHAGGAFAGPTAAQSFYVKCDHETNPPDVVAAGLVVTEIGVAPAAPAEFIVVRLTQNADGATVSTAA